MKQTGKRNTIILVALFLVLAIICAVLWGGPNMINTRETASSDAVSFSCHGGFYSEALKIKLKAPGGGKIHYTLDGSEPDENSAGYSGAIRIEASAGDYPEGVCVRAMAVYADGTKSEIYSENYIVCEGIEDRFSTYVAFISGNPQELTEEPDGILCEANIDNRGRETERKVNLQMFDSRGNELLNQDCGARPFGGASRHSFVKSVKLFARKEYDAEKMFCLNVFRNDAENGKESRYKKLVFRNGGNDFNFSYIRDELAQTMAYEAGYENCEGTVSVVVYINGKYNGLLWLHENYCDEFFKEKYGNDVNGVFGLVEGAESGMTDGDSAELIEEYNTRYGELTSLDLTQDENYEKLNDFIDVEDYLDYFAYNLYICNFDWPYNNNKAYKYVAGEGDVVSEGVFDGRWRFLLHDTDWSMGWDEFSGASYDNFAQYFEGGTSSPLFTALMKRPECRKQVRDKLEELMETVFAPDNALSLYHEMDKSREREQGFYQKWLEENEVYEEGDWGPDYDHYIDRCEQIEIFLTERPGYVEGFIEKYLNER